VPHLRRLKRKVSHLGAPPPSLDVYFGGVLSEVAVGEPVAGTSRPVPRGFTHSNSSSAAGRWLPARYGRLGLAGLLATATLIAVSAARTELLLPRSLRPVPSWLAGAFGHDGLNLGLAALIPVLSLMFVCYALVVRFADQLSARGVLIGVAGLLTLVLLAPPLLSTDVFSYIAYGRIGALYGASPYLHGPSAIVAVDRSASLVGAHWVTTPTAYGPLFTALSYLLAPFAIAANVLAYKAIAGTSSLVVVGAVWYAARLRGLNPVRSVALVGLNPVVMLYGVGGGHNDLLMVAVLTTGVYLLLRRNDRASGALMVAAIAVKLTAALVLPFALAERAGRRAGARNAARIIIGVGLAAAIAAVGSLALFGTAPLQLLDTLPDIQTSGDLQGIPRALLTPFGLQHHLNGGVGLILDAGLVLCVVWLLRRVWIGRLDWITGAGWATVALLISAGGLLPWYVGWLVPLAALSSDRRLLIATVVLTGIGLTTL
jgi:Glycosyltransferase family 87